MARYSIDEKILTDLADGIRAAVGKEEGVPAIGEAIYELKAKGTTINTVAGGAYEFYLVVPGASKVLVKDIVITTDSMDDIYFDVIASNNENPKKKYKYGAPNIPTEFTAIINDTAFRFIVCVYTAVGAKVNLSLTAIGLDENDEVLVNKEVIVPYDLTPEEMVEEVYNIKGLPDEALEITGDCKYRFANNNCDWLINLYGDEVTTKDLTQLERMFSGSYKIETIPFEINYKTNPSANINMDYMFSDCRNLREIPKINGKPKPNSMGNMFSNCQNLRYLPEDIETWFDWSYIDEATSGYSSKRGSDTFSGCCSLRSVPTSFLIHNNPFGTSTYCIFYSLFRWCHSLDEVVDFPIFGAEKMAWTSNNFNSTFTDCKRLKDFTFATNPDGSPIQVNWKNQTIELNIHIGYANYSEADILQYNSGITADKEVFDDATYQALKNDPDWFTCKIEYSRYNHDSAVRTINSLPDTSAFGTNNIKFKGASGSATDGGAINTLTAEEIAVATARGWTVSLT